ncbi:hypothetical protein TNCT_256191 [Trichonephila clavata]|uniref:C2H2-type domain-containing protein n=1 Tax=Trichonephila clavata TaxID=2740835 RepID=A0A8X6L5V1_TRICU|nr:hypothetical protein TNCT_256191 [Trichonephila clavata]
MPTHKSDMWKSTPRRHSRGSPIAHRIRRQITFERAVQIGLCKICYRVLPETKSLWEHIKNSHSPSAKQQHCLNSFPAEFHIDFDLINSNAWEIFFGTSRFPVNKSGDSLTHCSEPGLPIHDQSSDAAEKGLPTSHSQPTACLPGISVAPPPVSCVQAQTVSESAPADSVKPTGLSLSWCAPVQVYSDTASQPKGSELSKSLPFNLISLQHNSPIWPPVSPVRSQSPEVPTLVATSPSFETSSTPQPVCHSDVFHSPNLVPPSDQTVGLPTVVTICEIPSKTPSPPTLQSPNILDIVLGGDISLPDSPDLVSLKEAWPGELNGSPTHPAFPPPSYAAVAARSRTPTRATLFFCVSCDKKFYTQHGLHYHVCAGAKSVPDASGSKSSRLAQKDKTFSNGSRQTLPPRFQRSKQPISSTETRIVCLFCEREFKSRAALSQHSRALHGVAPQIR